VDVPQWAAPAGAKPACTLTDNGQFMGAVITVTATSGNVRHAEGVCAGIAGYSLMDSPWVPTGSAPGSQTPPAATSAGSASTTAGTSTAPNGTATTQYCISAWNDEASQNEKQAALSWLNGSAGLAASNYQNGDPSLCTITIGNSSTQEFLQFNQNSSRDGFQEGAQGAFSEIPSGFTWDVTLASNGNLSAK
jgi:hypothetical protein